MSGNNTAEAQLGSQPWHYRGMKYLLITWAAAACGLAVAAWLIDGIWISGSTDTRRALTLIVVAAIFGLVNAFVRPIVMILSLPFYLLTLGLFFLVVNALMLWLTSWLAGKGGLNFHVSGFWAAFFGAIIVSFVSWMVERLFNEV
jgi:putative membrane protein